MEDKDHGYVHRFNNSNALTASTVLTLRIKNAAGSKARARRINMMRIDDGGAGDVEKIHYTINPDNTTSPTGDPTAASQFLDEGGWFNPRAETFSEIKWLTANANCTVYVEIVSDMDISGSTFS